MVVVLLGYMASGKSTIGKILAKNLNYTFIDLDNYIVEKENLTVPEIFKQKGEIYFRKLETNYLKELLSLSNNVVLSLGGGTPCYSNNMEIILQTENVTSIYLKASIENLVSKLENKKAKRPLVAHLKTKEDVTEFIGKHLFERSYFYNQAEFVLTTDRKKKKDIIEEIILRLF